MSKSIPLMALWIAAMGTSYANAQQVTPPQPPPRANAPATQEYRVKQILGTKVSIQGDLAIGTVDDIVFGDDGYVEYLIVANQGKLVTVPWQAAKFNFAQQTATLNITQDQFKVIPTFTVERYPTFYAPTYRAQIYKQYGLTPRELRQIERRQP